MTDFVQALVIGIVVLAAVYMVGLRVIGPQAKRALGIFAGALGVMTTLFLRENPALLHQYTEEIVIAAIGVVLAVLVAFKKRA